MKAYLTSTNQIGQAPKRQHDPMTMQDFVDAIAAIYIDENAPEWVDWEQVLKGIKRDFQSLLKCKNYELRAVYSTHNQPFTVDGDVYTKLVHTFKSVEIVPEIQIGHVNRNSIKIGRIERR